MLDSADLAGGFEFGGDHVSLMTSRRDFRGLANRIPVGHQDGIREMGARVGYDDEREAPSPDLRG
jgi:hypothetical protein